MIDRRELDLAFEPDTMSIRHAILGLLAEQPMHGYRIKTAFDRRVSPLWGLTTGQVYQSLAALERNALVESRSERRGRRPERRVYSITASGKREIETWLARSPVSGLRSFRDETLIRLMLLRDTDAPHLDAALGRQQDEAKLLLMRVTRMRAEHRPIEGALDLTRIFLDGMTHRLEAEMKSLQAMRDAIEQHLESGARVQ